MKHFNWLFFLVFSILPSLGFGQDTLLISKADILQKISSQNLQLKISNEDFKSAKADYKQSNSLFLPNLSVSHTGILTTNPLMTFGSKLNQEILTASDFNPTLLNDPSRIQNFATKIEVLQPLINVDGLYQRQAAKAKMEAYQLQTERTKEYLGLESNKAFMQLQLAYKAVEVLEKAHLTANSSLKLVDNYFKQGMLQKTDLLSMQVGVTEIKDQLQYAKSNVQNASDYLASLLNEDFNGKTYKPKEQLTSTIEVESVGISFLDNRKDVLAMTKSNMAYQKMYQSAKNNFLPRLNSFGSYELYDKNIFGFQAKGYLLGFQLSWNIFDGNKSIAKAQKAKADFQKSTLEVQEYKIKSQLEINRSDRQLKDAGNKVNLTKLALEQSQEAYRIRKNRFEQGLEKTSDLLQSETQQYQKELSYLQAIFEYNFTKQYIQFLTK